MKLQSEESHKQQASQYQFTTNWIKHFTPLWRHYLAEFQGKENIQMLEIGSFEGRSALWFLENILTHESATLTCIDPFFAHEQELRFNHNIKTSGYSHKLTVIKAESDHVLYTLPRENFDVIYVDGEHRAKGVLMDAVSSWFLLKPQGMIIFDDYKWISDRPAFERPELAIDMFLELLDPERVAILHKSYQVILRKVR